MKSVIAFSLHIPQGLISSMYWNKWMMIFFLSVVVLFFPSWKLSYVTHPVGNMYLYYVLVKNSSVTELLQVWDILVQLGLESSRKNMKILVIS